MPSALADRASNRQFLRALAHHSAKAGPDNSSYPSVKTDGNHEHHERFTYLFRTCTDNPKMNISGFASLLSQRYTKFQVEGKHPKTFIIYHLSAGIYLLKKGTYTKASGTYPKVAGTFPKRKGTYLFIPGTLLSAKG